MSLSDLAKDVELAEERLRRGEIDVEDLDPYDRALIDAADRRPSWDRSSTPTLMRARSRASDREIRPRGQRRSFVPGAADAPSIRRRR